MQVVTSENLAEFVTTGKVADFVPPKPDAKTEAIAADVKPEVKPDAAIDAKASEKPSDEKARDETGKFVKADEKAAETKGATSATDDADEDAKLTEKIQRIIGKKHRAMREAEEFGAEEGRRAIEAERRADALQRQIDELQGKKSEGPKSGDGVDPDEPKQADFKTVGDYTRALVKYTAEKAGKNARQHAEQSRQQEHANTVIDAFVERQDAFKAATPDYEEVLESADIVVPPLVQQCLVESEVGPQLAYYFAKNPEEITRLKKLPPSRQATEFGKLETKFEKKEAAPVATARTEISKAPAPIQALEAKSAPVTNKDPKDMSFQELRAHRMAERASKGR